MVTQKIIEQRLDGDLETAKEKAQYSWQKDDIAWYFCYIFKDVFKVRFTGEHWLSGNKWGYNKIYQFEYLDSSGRDLRYVGENGDRISHREESNFFTTREAAIKRALRFVEIEKEEALKKYEEDKLRIEKYAEIEGC